MIARKLLPDLKDSLRIFPATAILGPRQSGKTTLAKEILRLAPKETVLLDLERPSDIRKLSDPERYLRQHEQRTVVLDEIQRMPQLFPLLRALIDERREPGRFLLLGSSSPELIRETSESLAGRIRYLELTPFLLEEVGGPKADSLWLRGGFPESFLSTDEDSMTWRESFIATFLERDIPNLGIRIPAVHLRRFWTMLAHLQGQLWNANAIAASMGMTYKTMRHYLDILEQTFLVRQLQPYHVNIGKRLVRSPKVYLRDSGILHALLNIGSAEELQGHPAVGASWEGFIVEQILAALPARWEPFFYRTATGVEMDLILCGPGNARIAVEIKNSSAPTFSKGFHQAIADLKPDITFVVYPGQEAYPAGKDITVLPVGRLAEIIPGKPAKPR